MCMLSVYTHQHMEARLLRKPGEGKKGGAAAVLLKTGLGVQGLHCLCCFRSACTYHGANYNKVLQTFDPVKIRRLESKSRVHDLA